MNRSDVFQEPQEFVLTLCGAKHTSGHIELQSLSQSEQLGHFRKVTFR